MLQTSSRIIWTSVPISKDCMPKMIFVVLFFLHGIMLVSGKKVPGGVSKTYQVDPDVVWTFRTSVHTSTANLKEAHLRNVEFSGHYNGDRAVKFNGTKTSYLTVVNDDGFFNGDELGAWFFYVKPEAGFTEGTIFEYEDECPFGKGLSVSYNNGRIGISFYSSSGAHVSEISSQSIQSGQWTFIGVSWHVQNPEIQLYIEGYEDPLTLALHSITQYQKFKATGHVRFGGSFDPNKKPFKGELRCLIYQDGFYFKKHTPQGFCDPQLRSSFVEGGTEIAESIGSACLAIPTPAPITTTTTPAPTTTTTASVPTTSTVIPGATTSATTNSISTTTTTTTISIPGVTTSVTTPLFVTSGVYNGTTSSQFFTSTGTPVSPTIPPPTPSTTAPNAAIQVGTELVIIEEGCYRISETSPSSVTNTTSFGTHPVQDLMSCAKLCFQNIECMSFWTNSTPVDGGVCYLGNPDVLDNSTYFDLKFFTF